jgi:transaldolase
LVTKDIVDALAIMRPVYDDSHGADGFVSIEVDPSLARDTPGTIKAAQRFHSIIGQPNLYVKIPATPEGVPAIQQMIAEGRSINVTLIFSLDRYLEVIDAYLDGLEAHAGDLAAVSSVASFFVSRVDTEVDRRLEAIGTPAALAARGTAAVAQAQVAYGLFTDRFSGPRWEKLKARGARVQRPLWASTSTKNPEYRDTLYVDTLIGPDTVNTMPEATLDAFDDHGTVARTVDADLDGARAALDRLQELGVDLDDVGRVLEEEGVSAFVKSFDEVLTTLGESADNIR